MEKVSIIIPVYNADKWLRRCVDSVLSQTYRDIEVILVNDGSKDNSANICDDYASEDNRVKVIHKENAGVSTARNDGINAATGEFIAFIDADDWADTTYIESFLKYKNFQLVVSGYKRFGSVDDERSPSKTTKMRIQDLPFTLEKYTKEDDYWLFVWGKLFRSDIIRDNNIRFCTKMKYLEDSCFVLDYLSYIDDIKVLKGCGLHHLMEKTKYNKYFMNFEQLKEHMTFQLISFQRAEAKAGGKLNKFKEDISRLHFNNFRRYLLWSNDSFVLKMSQIRCYLKNKNNPAFKHIKYGKLEKIVAALFFIIVR